MINRGFSFEVIIHDKEKGLIVGNGIGKVENRAQRIDKPVQMNRFPEKWSVYPWTSGPKLTDKYLNILFIPVLSLTYLRFNLKARPGATCQNSNMGLTFFVLL